MKTQMMRTVGATTGLMLSLTAAVADAQTVPAEESSRTETDLVIGRQRSIGSGVVIDAGGYIMTNAHVVANARRVEVVLPGRASDGGGVRTLVKGRGRTVAERAHDFDRLTVRIDPQKSLVAKLGILGVDITDENVGGAARLCCGSSTTGSSFLLRSSSTERALAAASGT